MVARHSFALTILVGAVACRGFVGLGDEPALADADRGAGADSEANAGTAFGNDCTQQ